MTVEFNFHGDAALFERETESVIERGIKKNVISQKDATLIREYLAEMSGQNRIGSNRKKKLAVMHVKNRLFLDKEYTECEYFDLLAAIDKLKNAKKNDGSSLYAKSVITERVWGFKHFFLWLIENHYNTKMDPLKVQKIKLPRCPVTTVTEQSLPTLDEICAIITSTTHPRDAAMLTMMFDGGLRFGDVCGIRFRDLRMTDNSIIVHTNYKTGRNRTIPLYNSLDVFNRWMAVYPDITHRSQDDFVFCHIDDRTKPLTYKGARKMFDLAVCRAGLSGRGFHPHSFRHARITNLLRSGMSESTLKLLAWGGESKTIAVYNHLGDNDVDRELRKIAGVAGNTTEQTTQMHCKVCGAAVTALDKWCPVCYANLDNQSDSRDLSAMNEESFGTILREHQAERVRF